MPDDERSRRRLGDATKSRIADLASGWSVDAPSSAEPPPLGTDTDPVARVDAPSPTSESGSSLLPPPPTPQAPVVVAPLPAPPPAVPPPPKPGTIPPPIAAPPREKKPTVPPGYAKIQAPVKAPAPEPPPSGPTRTKPKTNPPPPPGSPERKALEDKIVATKVRDDVTDVMPPRPDALPALGRSGKPPTSPPPPPPRTKSPTAPPPPPGSSARTTGANPVLRSKPPTAPPPPPGSPERSKPLSYPPSSERAKSPSVPPPPPGPKYPRAGYEGAPSPLSTSSTNDDSDAKPFASEARTPAVIIEAGAFAGNAPPPTAGELAAKQWVPTGEFGEGADTKQITAKRDAAEAILKIPDEETPVEDLEDGEPRNKVDPKTKPFERGDPTHNAPPDATEIQSPTRVKQLTGGTLRRHAALRRKRGLYGDVRYVFTAVFGVRNARGELTALEHRQEVRATSRRRHLITAGRAAATMDNFDHPALGRSRDTLALIEDERAKHAGAVAASDAELDRVRRDRETNRVAHLEAIAKTDGEIAELAKKLEPLEKEAAAARKKSSELREEVHRIDKKIADTEALLVSVKGEKLDKAGVQADIATFKANKQAVLRDEPVIAAELDALNPRIAALEATRSELQKKKLELDKSDQEDQRRTLELLEAIGAKRKVVERASADAETARDNALFELGERLYVDRPAQLSPQLSPIDRIDLEIGEDERRAMELKEILSNIDKAKFARGLAMIILALGGAITLTWLLLSMAG